MAPNADSPFRLLTSDGRWALEVSQLSDGQFQVLVILDGEHTTDSLLTADGDIAINWAYRQMKEVSRRSSRSRVQA
jgi:hypothetical protein